MEIIKGSSEYITYIETNILSILHVLMRMLSVFVVKKSEISNNQIKNNQKKN